MLEECDREDFLSSSLYIGPNNLLIVEEILVNIPLSNINDSFEK
jgi:hypothetical protein